MKIINRITPVTLIIILILPTIAFGLESKYDVNEIIQDIKEEYNINIVISNYENPVNLEKCLAIIEKGLNRFPKGLIKEITEKYLEDGIKTNIIIKKAKQNSFEIPAEYLMEENSANVTIYFISNNYYDSSIVISLDGLMHELGHLICDYLFKYYSYEMLDREFSKLNKGYEYGMWKEGYKKVYINQNSANNLSDDISDLIWIAESHPEKLRKFGKKEIIHSKIEFLSKVFEEAFESINEKTKLWFDTMPDSPDFWAIDTIENMENEGLIPEGFEGKYDSYLTREDFYILSLNIIKTKLGEEKFYNHYNITHNEKDLSFDPVKGKIIVDEEIPNYFYNLNLCSNKKEMYEAYKIGLIYELNNVKFNPEENITRLEAIKLSAYICEKFGVDIANNSEINFTDLTLLNDYEKLCVYFAKNKGLLLGYGNKLKPFEYCTYQEAYILINRVYEVIN